MAKTNSGLVAYVKSKVGCYYWFGCFGQMSNQKGLLAAKKAQYPRYYKADDFDDQVRNPKQVFDCAGLIKAYLWTDSIDDVTPTYNSKQDYGATAFYNNASVKGKIASFDKVPGRLVFKGANSKMEHVGVYIGDGKIAEAKGHKYGVIISNLDASWTHWCQSNLITDDTPKPEPTPTPTPTPEPQGYTGEFPTLPNRGYFKKGDKGTEVRKLQKLLLWISPGCLPRFGVDGDYGNETYNAVKVCQSILKVKVDGLYGRATQIAAKAYKK
jgi:hypothetical protein